jgi:hypothetical protein
MAINVKILKLQLMEEITRDLLVSLAAFGGIFGIAYVYMMTRYRERMSMLEKGVTPATFTARRTGSQTLKFGMLCVGIALGVLAGNVCYKNEWLDKPVAYLSMTFLLGGVSLIINHYLEQKSKH